MTPTRGHFFCLLVTSLNSQLSKYHRRTLMEKLLNINEVSDSLRLTPNYLINCCSKHPNRVPKSFKLNGVRRFKESDVEDWVEQRYRETVSRWVDMLERLLFCSEVSVKTGLTKKYITECCEKHPEKIPKFFILHGLRRWKESDVNKWLEQNTPRWLSD